MKWVLGIALCLLIAGLVLAATQVSIQGGPVKIRGGYVDSGTTVLVSTTPAPSDKAGQCVGILCGVTYN
jgi:hypothetical protein